VSAFRSHSREVGVASETLLTKAEQEADERGARRWITPEAITLVRVPLQAKRSHAAYGKRATRSGRRRSRGRAGPDDPGRGVAIARAPRAREQKQSCRGQDAHARMWAIARAMSYSERPRSGRSLIGEAIVRAVAAISRPASWRPTHASTRNGKPGANTESACKPGKIRSPANGSSRRNSGWRQRSCTHAARLECLRCSLLWGHTAHRRWWRYWRRAGKTRVLAGDSNERVAGKSAEPDAALLLRPERPAMSTPAVPFVAKRKPAKFRWVDRPTVRWQASRSANSGPI
jgi:hypothetical protein